MPSPELVFIPSLSQVDAAAWDALFTDGYPFTRHGFLLALEAGGSIGAESGWLPQYACMYREGQLIAAMPCYIKTHSYGEYLFDWAFAEAYERHRLTYYPKLVCAIPFTPATGPRLGLAPGYQPAQLMPLFEQGLIALSEKIGASGYQCLFCEQPLGQQLGEQQWQQRTNVQFHWLNRGYRNMDDFLARFSSRKRKNLLKERARVLAGGIRFSTLSGDALTADIWRQFYHFYRRTYQKRAGHDGYLTQETFLRWGNDCRDQCVLFAAYREQQLVAGALCFRSADTLYGRYWGCEQELEFLHFEACYYQGIEYCIEQGLRRFDAGAQGEHKLQRGFEPRLCYGYFKLFERGFNDAIADYCRRETAQLLRYQAQCQQQLPFKDGE
ncbi:GNAT family N-acetyltransferase [Zobellella maritima]|uniref:GNAT family N-acetyltransferase n=1 Tax=Zobellella maritima TaxID=2059725 RepID=UPI000E30AFB6|nr:GNAT family N-acetyltransferase [Zobellella maritima]